VFGLRLKIEISKNKTHTFIIMARLVFVGQTKSSLLNLHHYFDLGGCLFSIDTGKLCCRDEQAGFIVVEAGRSHFPCLIPFFAFA
jgi:hypothetical protein